MGMHLSVEVYEVFEKAFKGKDEAKKVMNGLEEAIVSSIHENWYRTKEELKREVFSEFATRKDLDVVRTELVGMIHETKAELLGKFDALYQKTEKDKAELVGMLNETKAELVGMMNETKAELLGIMKQDKAELLGKFDALYQKTEKDKAELLLKIERIDKKFTVYFSVLLFMIIFLNQNALEFIAKVLGLIK